MSIDNRDLTIGGIWADGAVDLPETDPVEGTTYAASLMSESTMANAWPYKQVVSTAHTNEVLKRLTTLVRLLETIGILPYYSLTIYNTGSICMGSDGNLYKSIVDSNVGHDPVSDTTHTYWVFFPDESTNSTNLLGGATGSLPYQSDTDETSMLSIGTAGYLLSVASSGIPSWVNPSSITTKNVAPVGSIFAIAHQTTPTGFLFCDGSAVSRSLYSDLFAALSTAFGSGDGYTTFNIPDLRGVALRGHDGGRGYDTDRVFGSYQADAIENITASATLQGTQSISSISGAFGDGGADASGTLGHTNTMTSRILTFNAANSVKTSTETRMKNVAINFVIKY